MMCPFCAVNKKCTAASETKISAIKNCVVKRKNFGTINKSKFSGEYLPNIFNGLYKVIFFKDVVRLLV